MSKITDRVTELVLPILEKLDLQLWDIEFVRIGGEQYLRVFIDRESGVTIQDCELTSKALDPLLDIDDLIQETYTLEVSSAGIERTLKKPEHFLRYIGENVEIKLYKAQSGRKVYSGILSEYGQTGLSLNISGEIVNLQMDNIAIARLKYLWN